MKSWKPQAIVCGAILLCFCAIATVAQWTTSKSGRQPVINRLCLDTSGSGTLQSCTTTPSFTPAAGDSIIYETTTTNTGDLTISVNGAAAKHARKWQGSSVLVAGDLTAGAYMLATYDGTYWEFYTVGSIGLAPTCAVTGAGSTGTCALETGSTNGFGGINITPSGSGIAGTGTAQVIFNGTFGTNPTVCMMILQNEGTGKWTASADIKGLTEDNTQWTGTWREASPLTSGNVYHIDYSCFAH